jgi:hypothetical protein
MINLDRMFCTKENFYLGISNIQTMKRNTKQLEMLPKNYEEMSLDKF